MLLFSMGKFMSADVPTNMVIILNENGEEIGVEEKISAHKRGLLHRAFSIFIFNSKDEVLLQKRAREKYHSGSLWSNTCCSHPAPGESILDAAHRRLKEEFGFDCPLFEVGDFFYKISFSNDLVENEHDYVIKGFYEGEVFPDDREVEDYKWVLWDDLLKDIKKRPDIYTFWLKKIVSLMFKNKDDRR